MQSFHHELHSGLNPCTSLDVLPSENAYRMMVLNHTEIKHLRQTWCPEKCHIRLWNLAWQLVTYPRRFFF